MRRSVRSRLQRGCSIPCATRAVLSGITCRLAASATLRGDHPPFSASSRPSPPCATSSFHSSRHSPFVIHLYPCDAMAERRDCALATATHTPLQRVRTQTCRLECWLACRTMASGVSLAKLPPAASDGAFSVPYISFTTSSSKHHKAMARIPAGVPRIINYLPPSLALPSQR